MEIYESNNIRNMKICFLKIKKAKSDRLLALIIRLTFIAGEVYLRVNFNHKRGGYNGFEKEIVAA